MANFCLKCWNEMNGTDCSPRKYRMSEELELCEGCGKWTNVVLGERGYSCRNKLKFLLVPFRAAGAFYMSYGESSFALFDLQAVQEKKKGRGQATAACLTAPRRPERVKKLHGRGTFHGAFLDFPRKDPQAAEPFCRTLPFRLKRGFRLVEHTLGLVEGDVLNAQELEHLEETLP